MNSPIYCEWTLPWTRTVSYMSKSDKIEYTTSWDKSNRHIEMSKYKWRRLLTKKLVEENWRYTFESFMVDTMIRCSITILPFRSFVWPSPQLMWLVILLIPHRVRGHIRRRLLFLCTYSSTWVFPSVRVVLSVTIFPGFVMIMDWWYLINGYTALNWKSKRPLKLQYPLLIKIYYFLWQMGPSQPSCMTKVTTSIFVS